MCGEQHLKASSFETQLTMGGKKEYEESKSTDICGNEIKRHGILISVVVDYLMVFETHVANIRSKVPHK